MLLTNPKSTFVSVLAWVFIVLGIGTTLIAVLQNLMLHWLFPRDAMANPELPALVSLMPGQVEVLAGVFFVFSLTLLITAVGLLKRKPLARKVFILIMALGMIWSLVSFFVMPMMMGDMPESDLDPSFQQMHTLMGVVGRGVAVVTLVVFGWIILRLRSPAVRSEFEAGGGLSFR